MRQFRLKLAAVPFFKKDIATQIHDLHKWKELNVDINALEEVEDIVLTYGIPYSESGNSLCGWSEKDGTRFHFTIKYPSVRFMENDKFSNGKNARELMAKIQNVVNDFYRDFVNQSNG